MTNPLTFPWDHCCQHARGQSRVYEPFPNGVPAITVFLPPSPGKHLQTRKLGVSICSLLRRPQGPAPNREHTPDLDPVTHWALTPSPEFSRGEHKRHRPLRGSVLLQTQLQTGSLPPAGKEKERKVFLPKKQPNNNHVPFNPQVWAPCVLLFAGPCALVRPQGSLTAT